MVDLWNCCRRSSGEVWSVPSNPFRIGSFDVERYEGRDLLSYVRTDCPASPWILVEIVSAFELIALETAIRSKSFWFTMTFDFSIVFLLHFCSSTLEA